MYFIFLFLLFLLFLPSSPQDDENSDEVKKELQRKWGMISLENDQTDYEIDTAALEAKVLLLLFAAE